MLEEKKPSLGDAYVAKARDALFGSWEMNWIAFNDAHDVSLPGSTGKPLPFLMFRKRKSAARVSTVLTPSTSNAISAREL